MNTKFNSANKKSISLTFCLLLATSGIIPAYSANENLSAESTDRTQDNKIVDIRYLLLKSNDYVGKTVTFVAKANAMPASKDRGYSKVYLPGYYDLGPLLNDEMIDWWLNQNFEKNRVYYVVFTGKVQDVRSGLVDVVITHLRRATPEEIKKTLTPEEIKQMLGQ